MRFANQRYGYNGSDAILRSSAISRPRPNLETRPMNKALTNSPGRIADAMRAVRHVFVHDLKLMATLGVYDHEKLSPQRIVVNVDLTVSETGQGHDDDIGNVVCYEQVVDKIKAIIAEGHVNLVETLAEQIAAKCLADFRVLAARVRVEKPDAIEEAGSVGIELERTQPFS